MLPDSLSANAVVKGMSNSASIATALSMASSPFE
jgi:hypothetical protein